MTAELVNPQLIHWWSRDTHDNSLWWPRCQSLYRGTKNFMPAPDEVMTCIRCLWQMLFEWVPHGHAGKYMGKAIT